jgi:hypothetical protein
VHKYLAKPNDKNFKLLSPDELSVAQSCQEQRKLIIEQVIAGEFDSIAEHRYWYALEHPQNFSGQPDEVIVTMDGKTALIIDYKSLPGDVESAENNLQLMSLVCLIHVNFPTVEECFAAIIQPLVSSKPTIAHYRREDMAAALTRILKIIKDSQNQEAIRNPGNHCQYCGAKISCPQAHGLVTNASLVRRDEVAVMTPDRLVILLNACKAAESIIKAVKERSKELLKENPECIPGWKLEPGDNVRSIIDNKKAYLALMNAGMIDLETFMAIVKIPLGELENTVAARIKVKKTEAKVMVNETLGALIEVKQKDSSLAQVK